MYFIGFMKMHVYRHPRPATPAALDTRILDVWANDIKLADSVPLPSGSVLVLVGGDQKLNMIENDLIKVKTSTGTVDVVMSILEIT